MFGLMVSVKPQTLFPLVRFYFPAVRQGLDFGVTESATTSTSPQNSILMSRRGLEREERQYPQGPHRNSQLSLFALVLLVHNHLRWFRRPRMYPSKIRMVISVTVRLNPPPVRFRFADLCIRLHTGIVHTPYVRSRSFGSRAHFSTATTADEEG